MSSFFSRLLPVFRRLLEGVIGLTRHDEISGEFAFEGSGSIRGVEAKLFTIRAGLGSLMKFAKIVFCGALLLFLLV
jgi:hypothetical protein